ncbi:reverse transcriptase domain, reverse transcriptase zinc-binding domain protein [Tanacetum coccineum]|uniref:Reverse transcriptase domain, reverse transcriptase zinc-binding domain protein n=1 Tax=Tanacetum coccineum TaxID=301880 RepID=A0ABQ5CM41_9ASTR
MGPILPPGLHFHLTWSRSLRSQHEIDELNEIGSLLSNLHLSNSHDTWDCYLNHSHGFSVNLIRKHIIHQSHNLPSQLFKWNNLVPIKVNINTWRILNQRMPTRINLDYRGIDLNSVRCPICDEDVETEDHIFVHCNLARKIWKDVLLWWKVDNINVLSLLEAINLLDKVSLPPPLFALFDAVVQATLWFLWRYRNEFAFSPKIPNLDLLFNDIKLFFF